MGTDNRENTAAVIEDLVNNGPLYNVWQAARVADSYVKKYILKEMNLFLNKPE
ncbi:MAG: hypothetical protein M5U17_10225 [Ignavibacterium sp.]|nr:hypothetical protein [Ignavibacterium sp.]